METDAFFELTQHFPPSSAAAQPNLSPLVLSDRIHHGLALATRRDTAVALALVRFHVGEQATDGWQPAVTSFLCETFRDSDSIAELPGDVWAVLLEELPSSLYVHRALLRLFHRIRHALAEAPTLHGRAGVATQGPEGTAPPVQFIAQAATALCRAQSDPRHRIALYDPRLDGPELAGLLEERKSVA